MANDFRIIGDRYISKVGDDINNDGLTPDTPKATLDYYATGTHIVGSGVYKGSFVLNTLTATVGYKADGYVKILCTGDFSLPGTDSTSLTIFNADTEGNYIEIDYQGFKLLMNRSIFKTFRTIHRNGIFQTTSSLDARLDFVSSVISDMISVNNYYLYKFDKTLIFNTNFNFLFPTESLINTFIVNSYADLTTEISMITYFPTPETQFKNNNFQCRFIIAGTPYELKKDRAGVDIPSRIGNGIADLASIDATVYDRGNFSQDPEFLNIEKRDYHSVASSSPMIFGASDGGNIGDVSVAVVTKVTDAEFTGGTLTDVVYSVNDLVLDFPAVIGSGRTTAIQLAPTSQVIKYSRVAALLNFNSDIAAGDPENYNVIANENYLTGTAGANPRRLTYKMRWTDSDILPVVDADWTNQGYTLAGEFVEFEHFAKPLVDVAGLGNGNPTFNTAGAVGILAKYVQFEQTLQNGLG